MYAGLLGGNDTYPSATLNGSSLSPLASSADGHGRCRRYQTSVKSGDVLKFTARGGNTTFGLMSYVVYG